MQQQWWRDAVLYQIYPRSFADADGDGTGDIAGITARLGHVADLGADGIWLSPFYTSPWADGGYDVADFRDVDPRLGTLEDFDAMVAAAHALGLRVMVDIVPNHTSEEHPWFREALEAGPGSPERELYVFRDGRGADGETLFDPNWADVVTTPTPGSDGRYGMGFWLPGEESVLPDGTFFANGFQGQSLYIVPERDLLVLRMGADLAPAGAGGLTHDVIEAMRGD